MSWVPVAVVHIPVDDRDPLATLGQGGRSDRDVVEEAEAHRFVGDSVVSGRPARSEGHVALPRAQRIEGIEDGADRAGRRRPRARREERVAVDLTTALL